MNQRIQEMNEELEDLRREPSPRSHRAPAERSTMSGDRKAEGFNPQNSNKINQRIQEMNEELEELRRELQGLRDRRLLAPIEPRRKDRR